MAERVDLDAVQDQLDGIKQRWFTDEQHRPEYWANAASRDVPRLTGLVEALGAELRAARKADGHIYGQGPSCPRCGAALPMPDDHP